MSKISFSELINIHSLEEMAQNLYKASGIPIGILDVDGTIYVKVGWQDICTKYHRVHPYTCSRCLASDRYINANIMDGKYTEYKCLNNMWDIAVPIIIAGNHFANLFLGQFFYEDEIVDIKVFRGQAFEFGFDEKEYLEALERVPRLSKEKVHHLMDYYLGLVMTLAESGLRQLELKNSQKELAMNQEYLNTIFNSVNDVICIHDFKGKIIDVNQTAITMFEYSYDEFINMNVKELVSEKSPLKSSGLSEIFLKASSSNPIIIECLCKTKSKKELWMEIGIRTMNLDNNEEIVATVRDITDRKLNELALQKEAQEIENLRTEFFSNISHELKTPLNIILGAIQVTGMLIQNEEKPINREKVLSNLNVEKQNCFRLLRLINNLIDSTKLDSGYCELNITNCNIINVVEEITLSVAQYINSNNLSLTFDTDIEEKIIACDLDKIERIMLNLLSNSVKFTPSGGNIYVSIFDGEEYITIVVEDTGIGIPIQKLNVIFDRFRQVDKSFTRSYEGSGIGLSLVKSLIQMHGGTISVESVFGVGSKFILKLPVKMQERTIEAEAMSDKGIINNCVERIKIEFSDIYK